MFFFRKQDMVCNTLQNLKEKHKYIWKDFKMTYIILSTCTDYT